MDVQAADLCPVLLDVVSNTIPRTFCSHLHFLRCSMVALEIASPTLFFPKWSIMGTPKSFVIPDPDKSIGSLSFLFKPSKLAFPLDHCFRWRFPVVQNVFRYCFAFFAKLVVAVSVAEVYSTHITTTRFNKWF